MAAHQLAQRADELLVRHTVHVDLLVLVLQAHEPPQVGVQQGLDQTVACERLLVGVCGLQALVAVRHLAGDARLDRVVRRLLLAELTLHPLAGERRHGSAFGRRRSGASGLAGGVGPALRRLLVAFDDVLQRNVALKSL